MRKMTLGLLAFVLTAGIPIAASAQAGSAATDQGASTMAMGKSRTYKGEIMDAACAKMGSHDAMMKKEGTTSAKDCSDKCVQAGSKYVLYSKTTKRTYQLDDQDKAKQFSGQEVTVKGTYDRATHTLKVESMEATS